MSGVLVTLAVTAVLLVAHEIGHFVAARLCGLQVRALVLGLGPAVRQWERQGTVYRLGAIPIGGYVRYAETPADAARRGARALVVLAGPLANVLVAALLLAIDFAHLGVAGAVARAFDSTGDILLRVAQTAVGLVTGAPVETDSPAAVARIAGESLAYGPRGVMRFAAVLSLNLAVMNLVPIPILDGGRLLLLVVEAILGRALRPRPLLWLALTGLFLLGAFVMLIVLAP